MDNQQTPYRVYGQLEWVDYEYDIFGEASLYPNVGRKYLLENVEDLWYTEWVSLKISDYTGEEPVYVPLMDSELEDFLIYYCGMYERKTGKNFFKRMQMKYNLSKPKKQEKKEEKKTTKKKAKKK